MPHLSTGRSGLIIGRGSGGSGPSRPPTHPQPALQGTFMQARLTQGLGRAARAARARCRSGRCCQGTCKRGAGAGSWGERRQTQRVASATRVLPLRAATLRAIPSNPYPTTAWRRGCRAVVAHRCVSAVRSPSCEGKLPLRSLLSRYLREGRRSGRSWGNGDGRRGWQVRCACFARRHSPLPPASYILPRLGGGGAEVRRLTGPSER